MREENKRALNRCRADLVGNMPLSAIVDRLLSKETITCQDVDQIKRSNTTSHERCGILLDILATKQDLAFDAFRDALTAIGYDHLAELLAKNLNCKITSMKNQMQDEKSKFNEKIVGNLKNIYRERLRLFNPFSLPFTFDIENTWISLGIHEGNTYKRLEDHCQLITEAFQSRQKLLLIEGRAASGKTSLMRRIAFDWANGKLNQYSLVVLVEFRHLAGEFDTIAEMILSGIQAWAKTTSQEFKEIKKILSYPDNPSKRCLILLDGYDEVNTEKPICAELHNYFISTTPLVSMDFDVIISSRPGPLTHYYNMKSRLKFAKILGFDKMRQRNAYISAHFSGAEDLKFNSEGKIISVKKLLKTNKQLKELAKTPLFLTFICLVHEHLKGSTIFELYKCIIWWLIDRYQTAHPYFDVPSLFRYHDDGIKMKTKTEIIQNYFLEFPLLQVIGRLALDNIGDSIFSDKVIQQYPLNDHAARCGIILEDKTENRLKIESMWLFPHRTLQEFLAGGCFYFWSESTAENKVSIDAFLSKNTKCTEIENFIFQFISDNFIFNSTSENSATKGIKTYIEAQTEFDVDLSQFLFDSHLAVLDTVLQNCKTVRELKLHNTIDVTMAASINLFDFQRCNSSISFRSFTFDKQIHRSVINISNQWSALKEITFRSITFCSSGVFCSTISALATNSNQRTMLQLGGVRVKLTEKEDTGISCLLIDTDCTCISSFLIAKEDASRYIFASEVGHVLSCSASACKIMFHTNANRSWHCSNITRLLKQFFTDGGLSELECIETVCVPISYFEKKNNFRRTVIFYIPCRFEESCFPLDSGEIGGLRKYTMDASKADYCSKNIRIMLVGETDTGKTTLLNCMTNYLCGVKLEDNFHFQMLDEAEEMTQEENENQQISDKKNEIGSVTKWVTTYVLNNNQPPLKANDDAHYRITIVDTPGFGDRQDNDGIVKLIKKWLECDEPGEQNSTFALCFIVKNRQKKLPPSAQYIFSSVLSLLENGLKTIVPLALVTFADGGDPPALDAMKAAKIPFSNYFQFDNSVFFGNNRNEDEREKKWKHTNESYAKFFHTLVMGESS